MVLVAESLSQGMTYTIYVRVTEGTLIIVLSLELNGAKDESGQKQESLNREVQLVLEFVLRRVKKQC